MCHQRFKVAHKQTKDVISRRAIFFPDREGDRDPCPPLNTPLGAADLNQHYATNHKVKYNYIIAGKTTAPQTKYTTRHTVRTRSPYTFYPQMSYIEVSVTVIYHRSLCQSAKCIGFSLFHHGAQQTRSAKDGGRARAWEQLPPPLPPSGAAHGKQTVFIFCRICARN